MIVGVDISSRRVDLAWLQNGKPCRWHQELEGKHLIDRLRSIRVQWPRAGGILLGEDGAEVTDVAIEYPFGRSRTSIAALMATVGVITRQAPPWARVAWPSSGELRAAIGAKNNKQHAHAALFSANLFGWPNQNLANWSEHELDALVAAVGWARILEAQE